MSYLGVWTGHRCSHAYSPHHQVYTSDAMWCDVQHGHMHDTHQAHQGPGLGHMTQPHHLHNEPPALSGIATHHPAESSRSFCRHLVSNAPAITTFAYAWQTVVEFTWIHVGVLHLVWITMHIGQHARAASCLQQLRDVSQKMKNRSISFLY